ncbi:MAG: putative DNA binding domain-containing protein [Leptospirales bacterium]|nr:putative DNA binding domain-containing protein [Leptospirales bacterium]
MNIKEIIKQPEGRRLEFKSALPERADLAKTIIAFSNDAGGELYIGIKNDPREIVGLPEENLFAMEEQISNIIFDRCYPAILPEITFLTDNDRHLIRILVYRGSMPPYHLKDKGKLQGTYIRVGSVNRQADETIIAELERRKRNISFDSELVMDKPAEDLDINNFRQEYKEKTGEKLDNRTLRKLELIKDVQGIEYPSNALVLFSDDKIRQSMFHYAKVECARFKGIKSEEFIDQKSIYSNISTQAEEAYNFVLRHINKGATVEGVYTVSRWEYPVKAIREVIRNAIVHRDYSLMGKDVKVAVYDDMIEITSPGLLPPSIDYSAMESRQSDARNKILAPIFKRLGIIDQWGNGLKLIADELKDYPQIGFRWKEVGLSFQVQFVKLDYGETISNGNLNWDQVGTKSGLSWDQVGTKLGLSRDQVVLILNKCLEAHDSNSLADLLGLNNRTKFRDKFLKPLLGMDLLAMTKPDKPTSSQQKYYTTEKGRILLSK